MQVFGSYLVGAVDSISLQLFGSYMVGAIGWVCRWSYLVVIWLVQLIGCRCSYLVLIWFVQLVGYVVGAIWLLSGWCSWTCRWSYLVHVWLVQLIGYIVAVIWFFWFLSGWCSCLDVSLGLFGSYLVGAVDWVYRWSYLALIWFIADWMYRWSYLVLIWFIADWVFDMYIVGVNDIWLEPLAIWLLQFTVGLCKLCNNTDHLRLHRLLCGNRL